MKFQKFPIFHLWVCVTDLPRCYHDIYFNQMYLDNDILPLTVSECFCRLYLLIIIWRVRLSVEIIWTFDPNASVSDILAAVSPLF